MPYPARWLVEKRWEDEIRDEVRYPYSLPPTEKKSATFDTDDFFEAAVRRANSEFYGHY